MLYPKIGLFIAFAAAIAAQDVENNDLPQECQSVCANLVKWSNDCDNNSMSTRAQSDNGLS